MRIPRSLPPTAAPISPTDLMYGFRGIANKKLDGKLERELKEYFGATHAFLVSSGKAALYLILSALKRLTLNRKVIIPAYTCFSVPSAIRMAGLEIVLCDIRPETLDFDYSQLRDLVDDDTMCVISTHLFGIPADVSKVRDLCGNRNIFIIEDAAQAMGAVSARGKLGTFGDVSFFSLGRGKNITCGSGGIIITSSGEIADSIQKGYTDLEGVPFTEYAFSILETVILMLFLHPARFWLPKQLPFLKIGETRFYRTFPVRKFTGFQAGLLHDWRQKLEMLNRGRSENADGYIERLELSNGMQIHSNGIPYNRFPMYTEGRESKEELCESGDRMGISPMYPFPIHRIQEIKEMFDRRNFEGAETITDTLVTLPTHILVSENDKKNILEAVKKASRHEQGNEQPFRQGAGCH